ncbi:MAG: DsbC family protein [Agarilytica sp.]
MPLIKQFSMFILMLSFAALVGCQGANSAKTAEESSSAEAEGLAAGEQNTDDFKSQIADRFKIARGDLVVADIQPAEAEGVYEVSFKDRGSVYLLGDGQHFFVGDLYQLQEGRILNVTEQKKNAPRAELMAGISRDDMIVFSPEGEVKASVVVFTDVDCGYCRKLHREVPRMNELGIEIKYLAYPRAGVGSPSYNKIASAWCADDRNAALTAIKAGEALENNVCDGNPVAEQFDIGLKAGLNGTPAIILESGELIPGYMPADKLAKTLGI